MIDTHCHLTYPQLLDQLDAVLARAHGEGVDRMITVGTAPDDAQRAVALAEQEEDIFATVGLHPHHAAAWPDRSALVEAMAGLAEHPKVVALGEMGLDYHYDDPPRDVQKRAFGWQLEMIAERGAERTRDDALAAAELPIVIHNRKATDDVLAMIRDAGLPGERFVFHCFTGSQAELEAILAFGTMVSFTGIITFSSARDVAEASDLVPIERLMVETDSPYLTPEPHRKVRPNEPRYVTDVARFLAARRGMTLAQFTTKVDANAERFFRLPPDGGCDETC